MKKFINRFKELVTLENEYQKESSFVVIYGRRRVGKTTLINKFLNEHNNHLYFLATIEDEKSNINYFKKLVADYTNNSLINKMDLSWEELFDFIIDYKKDEKKIIVIDEFQYLGKVNSAFPSIMQRIWDLKLKDNNVMLILCGSLISMMESQVLNYSSPLYGRRTAQIKLKQIDFKYYKEFFNDKKEEELIELYSVTGGVPKYIELFNDHKNIYESIKNNILSKQSYLYEEPVFLLNNEVNELGSYFSIIKAIALGNHKLEKISSYLGKKATDLSKYLKVLMDLDIIEREVPVTEFTPEKSKKGLYKIKDNFLLFWFKFKYLYSSNLEREEVDFVLNQIKKSFIDTHVAYVYEDICREKMWELNDNNTFSTHFNKLGRHWDSNNEIDIVAIDTVNKKVIIGECKYSKNPKDVSVYSDLINNKQKVIEKVLKDYEVVNYVIFSRSGYSKDLKDLANKNKKIILL